MKTSKEKAINLILRGLAIQFIPFFTLGVFTKYINVLSPLARLISLAILFSVLIGYYFFIKGCCLYIASKGYYSKGGFIGLLSLLGLSILLLIPSNQNAANLKLSQSESGGNEPFKTINIPELFMYWFIPIPFLFIAILGMFCLLNNLNLLNLIKAPSVTNLISIFAAIYIAYIFYRECQNTGLRFNQIIGNKRHINLKLIVLVVVLKFAFSRGFNSLLLYKLSFIFPEYVENYLNEKEFTNIPEMIAWSVLLVIFAPLIEEFFFRGIVLQKWAIKWGVKTGILTSSLFFAIIHFRFDIIYLVIAGIIYSILYFKTRSLIIPILLHSFHNTIVAFFVIKEYLSKSAIERNAFISVKDYQASIQPLLGQRVFLIAISVPVLIYFVYKYFPRNDAIIPYYANAAKIPENN